MKGQGLPDGFRPTRLRTWSPRKMDGTDSENEVNETQHSNLLAAVSQLDVKQRVKPPSRKESSFQVSEFHLVKSDSNKKDVEINKLAKALDQRGSFAPINKKLRKVQKTSKPLPPPLEKPATARIRRSVAFQNVKQQLGRWDAVIESNRASDHLQFPLNQPSISFVTTNDFISKLKSQSRTTLEAKMDEILNNSPVVQAERKEEEEFKLTLAEMRERRSEMAKMRAQQSYMAAKATRQKRIKSKKFHRIQRRERIRQQLKEFEALQKTDPEAALKQLEQLERTRAEERVSLRHRSTGQWARNKAVRAKYDQESRRELAQQLAVSRDLTQKVQAVDSSDEEEVDDKPTAPSNSDNPWIAQKSTSEVEEFISNYRKFWDKHNKKVDSEKVLDKQSITNGNSKSKVEDLKRTQNSDMSEDSCAENEIIGNKDSNNRHLKDIISNVKQDLKVDKPLQKDERTLGKQASNAFNQLNVETSSLNNETLLKETTSVKKSKNVSKQAKKKKKNTLLSKLDKDVHSTTNSWTVFSVETSKNKMKKRNAVHIDSEGKGKEKGTMTKTEVNIEKLFDNIEKTLKKKVNKRLKRARASLKEIVVEPGIAEPGSEDDGPSLKLKKHIVRPELDEQLIEETQNVPHNAEPDLLINELVSKSNVQHSEAQPSINNIDPNRFIAMKPKHLKTELPDLVTGGDEGIDDSEEEEDDNEERQKAITEAFAEDDVVADFRKEKEEEQEKSNTKNVDLTLPGWGEWGGKNIQISRRKKKRFIINFPKVPPRKDANKGNLIINEEKNDKVKVHQVNELPFPFTSVKDFEASIRAPLGNTWVPETAHRKLILPQVVTKLGNIIKPMDEDMLVNKKIKAKDFP